MMSAVGCVTITILDGTTTGGTDTSTSGNSVGVNTVSNGGTTMTGGNFPEGVG